MKVFSFPLIGLLACWPILARSLPNLKTPRSLLLEHVTVIDSTGSAPRPDTCVLIEGGKIKSIASSGQSNPADGSLIVDARGKFLIAGLWDMHVHAFTMLVKEGADFLKVYNTLSRDAYLAIAAPTDGLSAGAKSVALNQLCRRI